MVTLLLIGVSFGCGFACGAVAVCLGLSAIDGLRARAEDHDVRCPRCDPDRSILDIHDGAWVCLACGYEWRDPDLPRDWQRRIWERRVH